MQSNGIDIIYGRGYSGNFFRNPEHRYMFMEEVIDHVESLTIHLVLDGLIAMFNLLCIPFGNLGQVTLNQAYFERFARGFGPLLRLK